MPIVAFQDMNYNDSSDDSIRRLTDEYGRHRLTDVLEADENEEDHYSWRSYNHDINRKRYSSPGSNASSIDDALWETHPRRLSEAGLSRHSDSSAILTEDTDSFIIGQRVWVGGSKPGKIAFIGETQFAPGDWAGIVLDEPIGKNDGSVSGIRYFQCESKKGVFSRLTRLTRVPLDQPGMGSGDTFVYTTPNSGVRKSPISPSGSSRSLLKSPMSISGSNTSLASTVHIDYKIGDRVIVKSSQGSKVGHVRYIGTTEFANGEWVGVELDEPRGKNDGSVNGKRYFECRANCGLFAPPSKVSKSPSKVKPSSCHVHSGSGLPPSGLRRANSKESMVSLSSMTSAASGIRRKVSPKTSTPLPTRTALQDVLKEKQQHIEQLLKERDLERAEITRAASQAEEAEHKLVALRQEYEKYRSDCEVQLQEHLILLEQLKRDRSELVVQLENEKRKNEDLQFQFEEASITKADVEAKFLIKTALNETNDAKIKELEELLISERQKGESDTMKLFETEETMMKTREEIDALRNELQIAKSLGSTLEGEKASTTEIITKYQNELEETKKELLEKLDALKKIEDSLNKANSENAIFQEQLKDIQQKFKAVSDVSAQREQEMCVLNSEIINLQSLLKEKVDLLESTNVDKNNAQDNFNKELEKLKMDLSAKNHDFELQVDILKEKENNIIKLQTELDGVKYELQTKNNDLEKYRNNLSDLEQNLKTELEKSINELKTKTTEFDRIQNDLNSKITESEKEIQEKNKVISMYAENIKKLTEDVERITKSSEEDNKKVQEKFVKDIKEKEEKICQISDELNTKNEDLIKTNKELNELKEKLLEKSNLIENLTQNLDQIKSNLEIEISNKTTELNKTVELLKEKENQIQGLQTELQTTRLDLQTVSNDLVQYQNNLSDVETNLKKERDDIREDLKTKITELEELKNNFKNITEEKDNIIQNSNNVLAKKDEELNILKGEIVNLKKTIEENLMSSSEKYEADIGALNKRCTDLSAELKVKTEEVTNLFSNNNKINEELVLKNTELDTLRKEYKELQSLRNTDNENITELNTKVEELSQLKQLIHSKDEEISKLYSDLETLKKQLETDVLNKNSDIDKFTKLVAEKETTIEMLKQDLNKSRQDSEKSLEETKNQYQQKLIDTEKDLLKQKSEIEETLLAKIKNLENMSSQITEEMSIKNKKIEETDFELKRKLEEIQNLNSELNSLKSEHDVKNKGLYDNHKKDIEERDTKLSSLNEEVQRKLVEINKLTEHTTQLEQKFAAKSDEYEKLFKEFEQIKSKQLNESEIISNLQKEVKELQHTESCLDKQLLENEKKSSDMCDEKLKLEKQLEALTISSDANNKHLEENKQAVLENEKIFKEKEATLNSELEILKRTLLETENDKINLEHILDMQKTEYEEKLKSADQSERVMQLEEALKIVKNGVTDRERMMESQNLEIVRLKQELTKVQQNAVNGNAKLEPNEVQNNNNTNNYKQLLEEKLFAENQVAFLNSIIVDMQKKNEEQKARIEILEMGYSPNAAAELNLLGFDGHTKNVPPRVYCDICEEFDLHETEDCPQQSDDPVIVQQPVGKTSGKEKPPPRPYCDICEVFGHNTEDCSEDQEF